MAIDVLAARFKSHAEQAAGQREADGREANEEGSFLNLVLCYSENTFLQTVRAYLEGKGIEIAVLMLDGGLMAGCGARLYRHCLSACISACHLCLHLAPPFRAFGLLLRALSRRGWPR